MGNSNFPNLVKSHFDFLLAAHGFSVTSELFTGFPLSEWIIDLCSERLCIRVSLDKAQVFIDVGSPADEVKWLDLMSVMMYMTSNDEWKYLWPKGKINDEYYSKQLAYLSSVVKEYLEQITAEVTAIATDRARQRQFEKFLRTHSEY